MYGILLYLKKVLQCLFAVNMNNESIVMHHTNENVPN